MDVALSPYGNNIGMQIFTQKKSAKNHKCQSVNKFALNFEIFHVQKRPFKIGVPSSEFTANKNKKAIFQGSDFLIRYQTQYITRLKHLQSYPARQGCLNYNEQC